MQGNRLFSILLILVLLALPELGLAQEITVDSVYQVVFQDLTAVEASEALPNIGQTLHLLAVVFPDESATVSSLKVRIEAAFNEAGPWFPISPDITEAPLLGGIVLPDDGRLYALPLRASQQSAGYARRRGNDGLLLRSPAITQHGD